MLSTKLRCKRGKAWLPDEFLTDVVDHCSRGRFRLTCQYTFHGTLSEAGVFVAEIADSNLMFPKDSLKLEQLACAKCGGPVEWAEVDAPEILSRLRHKEVDMRRAQDDKERTRND